MIRIRGPRNPKKASQLAIPTIPNFGSRIPDPRIPTRFLYPQNDSSFRITSPTMLFGVEAPAVRPTTTVPFGGSHPRDVSSMPEVVDGAPTGRWRISSPDSRHSGSAM